MNEERYIGFESYLNNEMPAEERTQFEAQLQSDAKLRASFNLYKETTQFLENKFSSETADFKNNLKVISESNFSNKEKKEVKVIAFKPWYYAVAATITLMFGAWFFMQNDPQYGDYNQHENAYFTERGSIIKNLKLAQEAFNSKNYKVAVENFEIVLKDYDKPEIRYFYAISLIEENRFVDAESNLTAIKNGKSVYKDKAIWYLALSNLKQKKMEECKTYLKQIPTEAEDYDKAQELLKELE